jgi:hypothetical protein
MLNLTFPITMTGGRLKIAKNKYFAMIFEFLISLFKTLSNMYRFSVFYHLLVTAVLISLSIKENTQRNI